MPKFTRADLRKILGEAHTEEVENQIMALHLGVVDAIKDELSKVRAEADKLPEVQAELEQLKNNQSDDDSYKAKYEKEHKDFEQYKADLVAKEEAEKIKSNKLAKYRDLLKKAGIHDRRIDTVLKVSDLNGIELTEDGNIQDADSLVESIKSEWSDFIVKEATEGAEVSDPPGNNGAASKPPSRAAQLQSEYMTNRYGAAK